MKNVWNKNKVLQLCLCLFFFTHGLTVFSAPAPVLESSPKVKNVTQTKKQSKIKAKLDRKLNRVKKKLNKLTKSGDFSQRSKTLLIISLVFLLIGVILLLSISSAGCLGALLALIVGIGAIIGGIVLLIIAVV